MSRQKLPIPLTCSPQVENGRCIHSFDNGACELPDQFMCPLFLYFEQQHPEKIGDAPKEIVDRILNEKPITLDYEHGKKKTTGAVPEKRPKRATARGASKPRTAKVAVRHGKGQPVPPRKQRSRNRQSG